MQLRRFRATRERKNSRNTFCLTKWILREPWYHLCHICYTALLTLARAVMKFNNGRDQNYNISVKASNKEKFNSISKTLLILKRKPMVCFVQTQREFGQLIFAAYENYFVYQWLYWERENIRKPYEKFSLMYSWHCHVDQRDYLFVRIWVYKIFSKLLLFTF